MFSRLLSIFVVLIALAAAPAPGYAADGNEGAGLIPNANYRLYFVHTNETAPGEATLRITQPTSISGCVTIEQPTTETKILPPRMEIKINPAKINIDRSKQYGGAECGNGSNIVQTDIILNRDMIMNDGITTLTLKNNLGMDKYTVYADENQLRLTPQSEMLFKPWYTPERPAPLTYWSYPDNLIILSAPAANADVTDQLKALATQRGMIEAKMSIADFQPPSTAPNTLYVIDQTQSVSKSINGQGSVLIGTVQNTEMFQGPNGPYEVNKNIDVHARLPGLYE